MIVYLVRNRINGKGYVGQTIQPINQRWRGHISETTCGSDYAFHRAIRKHGVANFEICVLANAHTLDELNRLEDFHIRTQNTLLPHGYNSDTGGKNHKASAETRQKISAAAKKRPKVFGRTHSQATKDRLREIATGRKLSAATRQKLKVSSSGRQFTASRCAKISAAKRGKKRPEFSPEWRQHMSAAHTGVKRAPFTPTALVNMSVAQKASYARRKELICSPTIH